MALLVLGSGGSRLRGLAGAAGDVTVTGEDGAGVGSSGTRLTSDGGALFDTGERRMNGTSVGRVEGLLADICLPLPIPLGVRPESAAVTLCGRDEDELACAEMAVDSLGRGISRARLRASCAGLASDTPLNRSEPVATTPLEFEFGLLDATAAWSREVLAVTGLDNKALVDDVGLEFNAIVALFWSPFVGRRLGG